MMIKLNMAKTLTVVVLGSALMSGSVLAQSTTESAGQKVDSSMNKVGNFMDDSSLTAKVKAALVDEDSIKSTDISVKTDNKVVLLTGTVETKAQAEKAENVTKTVEGVQAVHNELKVK